MSTRTLRITVRGLFTDLTADQRATLLSEAADHDFLYTQYTPEGYLAYDVARQAFAFRFLAEAPDEEGVPDEVARAVLTAEAWLRSHGYLHRKLTSTVDDLSQAKAGARQRRRER